ncbi:rhomboid family intramembrane serine protease [Gracilibacillus phocaeensis]|uniref:rhomboid family intramembrane serine protease n=1 Tax=Gracilibacillus phocaeensis TaxID=2042304 RepID=UPI001031A7B2|nr:rhomboid family intramembrane serine protease [Gracilibacillus phocaeensis]
MLESQFVQCQLVLHLIEKEQFELVTISSNQQEYLLWRRHKRHTEIVHVSSTPFSWQQELERVVRLIEQNALRQLQQSLLFQKVSFYHVFLNERYLEQDWHEMSLEMPKHKKVQSSDVYVWHKEDQQDLARFFQEVKLKEPLSFTIQTQGLALSYEVTALQKRITDYHQQTLKDVQAVFQRAKPYMTYLLLAINLIMFFLLESNGGSTNTETLIDYGAKYNVAILDGEWWRILSSMFLHIGFVHLILNMLALYFIGTLVEGIYGNVRFTLIYFLSGIAGGLCSFAFSPSVGAGASGALFGLFGALLYFGLKKPNLFFQTIGANVLFIVAINVVFGFVVPQVDHGAHLGGLVGGFLVAAMVMLPKTKGFLWRIVATVIFLVYLAAILLFGLSNDRVQFDETMQILHVEQLQQEDNYSQMIDTVTQTLPHAENYQAELLFLRSIAYVHTEDSDQAIRDLEQAVHLKSDFENGWYNLALLYHLEGQQEDALIAAEQLLGLNDQDESYLALYDDIRQEQESH